MLLKVSGILLRLSFYLFHFSWLKSQITCGYEIFWQSLYLAQFFNQ